MSSMSGSDGSIGLVASINSNRWSDVESLLRGGAFVDIDNTSLIKRSIGEHRWGIAELFLDRGAGAGLRSEQDAQFLLDVVLESDQDHLTRVLLEQAVNIPSRFDIAVRKAAELGHVNIIKEYIHLASTEGCSAALVAGASCGHVNIVEFLSEWGVNVYDADSCDGALIGGAFHGHVETVEYLLSMKRANIHARDDQALRMSVILSHQEVVKLLLRKGAAPLALGSPPLGHNSISKAIHDGLPSILMDRGFASLEKDFFPILQTKHRWSLVDLHRELIIEYLLTKKALEGLLALYFEDITVVAILELARLR